jgi:hypothetical protein
MDLLEPLEGEEGAAVDFPLSRAWWASVFNILLAWEDFTGEWSVATWTMGLIGGEAARTSWASHDVGRLSGGQSPAIHHFQGPWVAMRHEEVRGYRGLSGVGKEAF